jgi:hypothetical protein
VKHAGSAALDDLEDVLARVRAIDGLRERSRGVFYRKGTAFLHFHEDPEGPFADLRAGTGWTRVRVRSKAERAALVSRAARSARRAP